MDEVIIYPEDNVKSSKKKKDYNIEDIMAIEK